MMQFFTDLFGPSFGPTAAYIALLLLIVLIALAAWFAYRAFNRPRLASGKRSRQTRLAITDVALVDKHRRLVLLRRDDVEHLIMIGGHGDLVIEKDIRRNAPARPLAVPESKPAATATSSKKTEPEKQSPAPSPIRPKAPPTAASASPPKPEPKPLAPLKLQEEAPSPSKIAPPEPASASPATAPSYTPKTIAAATGALAASASAIKSEVSDAATSVKSGLAMPVTAKPTIQDEKKPADVEKESVDAEQKSALANPDPDPAALKEMDALLEELAVPKK